MNESSNPGILICHPIDRIDDQKDDIGSINAPKRFDDAILLQLQADPALSPDPRCIDEDISLPLPFDRCVNGVSRRTRNLIDKNPFVS